MNDETQAQSPIDPTQAKWPRTYHLPSSPGLQNDDRRHPDITTFKHREVAITEKMDGEGATMTREKTYPRSPDGRYHPSREMMKRFHAERAHMIPEGWRVSGEYMYARHSIAYLNKTGNPLKSWFYGFGIWNENNVLLAWDKTLEYFEMLDIVPAPQIYLGPWKPDIIETLAKEIDTEKQEGFVVRISDPIPYPSGLGDAGRFFRGVAKWVRKGHVQSDQHWAFRWRDEPDFRNELEVS